MSEVEHIIWDWNGTLFADGEALIEATVEAFRAAGLPPITRADYRARHRQPIPEFYESLAGRALTAAEQATIDRFFQRAYLRRRDNIPLTHDAVDALNRWRTASGRQSLLSMHPHERLIRLVDKFGIGHYFRAVDGLVAGESGRKAPHLRRHLDKLGADPERTLLVGDSVDDATAALECGVMCLLYHAGDHALHAVEHFEDVQVPIVRGLGEMITRLLNGTQQLVARRRS